MKSAFLNGLVPPLDQMQDIAGIDLIFNRNAVEFLVNEMRLFAPTCYVAVICAHLTKNPGIDKLIAAIFDRLSHIDNDIVAGRRKELEGLVKYLREHVKPLAEPT